MMMTKIAAIGGTKMEAVLTATAAPVSIVETSGLASPPVVAVEVNLPAALAPFMAVAVPPPAMIAKDQVTTGSKSVMVDTITAVPAIPAKGKAKLSKTLSIQGMKYANISAMVATPKVITEAKLPSQCQFSFSSQTPKWEAKLSANKGKNTLNPAEAASPIPRKILIMVLGSMFILGLI